MTNIGILTLDDSDIFFDAGAQSFLELHGFFFGSSELTLFGRKLQSDTPSLTGFFTFMEEYDWQCDSQVR